MDVYYSDDYAGALKDRSIMVMRNPIAQAMRTLMSAGKTKHLR